MATMTHRLDLTEDQLKALAALFFLGFASNQATSNNTEEPITQEALLHVGMCAEIAASVVRHNPLAVLDAKAAVHAAVKPFAHTWIIA